MNAYQLHLDARRARTALQSHLLTKFGTLLVEYARRGWVSMTGACRRRLRTRNVVEA